MSWLRILAALLFFTDPAVGGPTLRAIEVEEDDGGEIVDAHAVVRQARLGQHPPAAPARPPPAHRPRRRQTRRILPRAPRPTPRRPALPRLTLFGGDEDGDGDGNGDGDGDGSDDDERG